MSGLAAEQTLSSVVLTWSAPGEPNGVIIDYEVTYSVDGRNNITTNTTNRTSYAISSLITRTRVSNISVSAYTRAGRGEAAALEGDKVLLCKKRLAMGGAKAIASKLVQRQENL